MTMTLDTTPEDLTILFGALAEGESAQSKAQMDVIATILPKLTVSASARTASGPLNSVTDPTKVDAAFTIAVDGKPLELRWVDSQAFLQADVEGIGQATGLFTATQVKMMVGQLGAQLPWVTDLIEGSWITVDKDSSAKIIAKVQEGTASAQATAQPTLDPVKVRDAFLDSSEVTKVDDTTFKVSTDVMKYATAIAAISDEDQFTPETIEELDRTINDGATLHSTYTVKDGKVVKATIDIADALRTIPTANPSEPAIARLAAAEFTLNGVVELDNTDPKIAAPSPATTIPASDIDPLLKG